MHDHAQTARHRRTRRHAPRAARSARRRLQPGDLVVANDAATLPASLHGTHASSGQPVEIRLAGRSSLDTGVSDYSAVVFGAGDFHTRTEDRPLPPPLAAGDRLELGPLTATVTGVLGHPRFVSLHFHGSPDEIWAGIARHGRPIQYAHVQRRSCCGTSGRRLRARLSRSSRPLPASRSTGTRLRRCALAASDSPPSRMRQAFLQPETLISTSGFPLTNRTTFRLRPRRAIAVGAFEGRQDRRDRHDCRARARACRRSRWSGPCGTAAWRLSASALALDCRVVDAILTGVHERGTSHYELLRAFVDDSTLSAADEEMAAQRLSSITNSATRSW